MAHRRLPAALLAALALAPAGHGCLAVAAADPYAYAPELARFVGTAPPPPPPEIAELVGRYGADAAPLHLRESDGRLEVLIGGAWFTVDPVARDRWRVRRGGRSDDLTVARSDHGAVAGIALQGRTFPRRDPSAPGETFRVAVRRPVDELRRAALAARPPPQPDGLLPPDLVDLALLDPTIRFDIRYAGENNFVGTAFYSQPRAFLQRPAAAALLRAHRALGALGYGVLVHDAYRPWHVTKMFWDATPAAQRDFVANPATGSRHNRGAAVDLTLYHRGTGQVVEMPSGYDEFTERAAADFAGGTSLQRWHRELLRAAMRAQDFHALPAEWWHFDHRTWRRYPVLDLTFEELEATGGR
jgi:D-alanyl-D-alanine dipeptidase